MTDAEITAALARCEAASPLWERSWSCLHLWSADIMVRPLLNGTWACWGPDDESSSHPTLEAALAEGERRGLAMAVSAGLESVRWFFHGVAIAGAIEEALRAERAKLARIAEIVADVFEVRDQHVQEDDEDAFAALREIERLVKP